MIELPNLNIELTEVANLPFDKLKHMYVYLFNRTVNSSRREFFIWRITYRLQELRFGGLDAKTKAILENLDKKPKNYYCFISSDFMMSLMSMRHWW